MNVHHNALAMAEAFEKNTIPAYFGMARFYTRGEDGFGEVACIAGMAILMFGTEEEKNLLAQYHRYQSIVESDDGFDMNVDDIERAALRILGPAFNERHFYNFSIGFDAVPTYIRDIVASYERKSETVR